MENKNILRGVHVRIGPLPVRMGWDLEMDAALVPRAHSGTIPGRKPEN